MHTYNTFKKHLEHRSLVRPFLFYTKDPHEYIHFMWRGVYSYLMSHGVIGQSELFTCAAASHHPYFMQTALQYYNMTPELIVRCCLLSVHAGHSETLETFINTVSVYTLETVLLRIDSHWYHQRCKKLISSELRKRIHK